MQAKPTKQVTVNEADVRHQAAAKKDPAARFKETWKIPARYNLLMPLGSGAYGQVCQAQDREVKRNVAIKQAKHLLDDVIDAKRILREMAILGNLNHPNVCRLFDLVVPADLKNFNEVYMVLELCDSDLKKLCRAEVSLSELHVTTLLYNLLLGLNYLHSAGIWHRDLKPANCLVNEDCTVKICDFGLSRAVGGDCRASMMGCVQTQKDKARALTGHVVTRWYRAPELILLQERYTEAIDIWSVGCIYAELLGMLEPVKFKDRGPLFPGHSCFPLSPHEHHKTDTKYYTRGTKDQLSMINKLIGTPTEEEIAKLDGEDARQYMRCFGKVEGCGVKARFGHLTGLGSDLLEKMLFFDAAKRISVSDALQHVLFVQAGVRNPSKETRADGIVSLAFEKEGDLDDKQLRKLFLAEIRKFHPEVPCVEKL